MMLYGLYVGEMVIIIVWEVGEGFFEMIFLVEI